MSADIQVLVVREVPASDQFKLTVTVIDAVNIPLELFVFDVGHDAFMNVATVYDLETYPVGKTAAVDATLGYYRASTVVKTYDTVLDATLFERVTRERLKTLCVAWNGVAATYPGENYYKITS